MGRLQCKENYSIVELICGDAIPFFHDLEQNKFYKMFQIIHQKKELWRKNKKEWKLVRCDREDTEEKQDRPLPIFFGSIIDL